MFGVVKEATLLVEFEGVDGVEDFSGLDGLEVGEGLGDLVFDD